MTEVDRLMDFIDLKAQQARIRNDIDRRIAAVLDHGLYIMGPELVELRVFWLIMWVLAMS